MQTAKGASSGDAGSRPPYVVDIKANGTGCPAGSWETSISPDGSAFLTQFSSFEVQISEGQTLAVKDCVLSVRLRSDTALSYAVSSFFHQGYALLDKGVQGMHASNVFFAGAPAPSAPLRTDLKGPHDDGYRNEQTIPDEDLTWTPCGRDRNLMVQTRISVRKTQATQGVGYINLSVLVPDATGKVTFGLKWRACEASAPDASTPVPSAPAASLDAGAP